MINLSTRQYIIGLVLVFAIALFARLALTHQFVGFSSPPDVNANSDQLDYEVLAHHLVTGQGYAITPGKPTASRTPGTSLTLAPVYFVFGRSFALGRLWFCLLSAGTCALAVCLGAMCFNRLVGLLAGIGLAIYPGHAYNAMHFVSETPFGFWMLLALFLTAYAMRKERGGWWINSLAGACWAMAIYTRPQLLLAIPIAGGLAGIALLWRHPEHIKLWAIQVVVLLLVLSPWIVRNDIVMGKPSLSTITGYGLWGSHNELTFNDKAYRGGWVRASILEDAEHPLSGNEVDRNDQATQYGIQAIKANSTQMPGLIAAKLWRLATPFTDTDNKVARYAFALSWITVAPLLLLGLVIAFKRAPATAWMLALPILATIAGTVIYYGSVRFRDSVAPVILIFVGIGAAHLINLLVNQYANQPISRIEPTQTTARAA